VAVHLEIAIVEKDPNHARMIVDKLIEARDCEIHVIGNDAGPARRRAVLNPDMVPIDLPAPSHDMLAEPALASGPMERPVAMFVDRSDGAATKSAIKAGVSAHAVGGLRKERIKPILGAASARFHRIGRIRAELSATKAAQAERKTIDRAKGLLMKAKGLSEEGARADAQGRDGSDASVWPMPPMRRSPPRSR
jgi:response regulator NasT